MSGVVVRAMLPADLPAISVIEESWRPPRGLDGWQLELDRKRARPRIALLDGVAAGYTLSWIAGDEIELHELAVAPAAWRRGVGTALLADLARVAWANGCRHMFLEVRAGNARARALYEQAGFICVGARRRYYDDGEDAALYGRSLFEDPAAG